VSTILACAVTVEPVTRIAANLLESGITMPTFVTPTVPGASVEANDAVFEVFQERLFRSNLRPRSWGETEPPETAFGDSDQPTGYRLLRPSPRRSSFLRERCRAGRIGVATGYHGRGFGDLTDTC